jgi:putative transposase
MVTNKGVTLGRWLAGKLMAELNMTSCQRPTHKYKLYGQEHVELPNLLKRQFAVTQPNEIWCADATYSVPAVEGEHGCSNEPRVCLEY